MKQKVINVTIQPDGTVELAPDGFKGKACKDATKFLEQALGLTTDNRKLTSEFYETESVKQTQKT